MVYVDVISTRDSLEEIKRLKENLASEFKVKDLGQIQYFLRTEVARSKGDISVFQQKYVFDLVIEIRMLGCKPSYTSIKVGKIS